MHYFENFLKGNDRHHRRHNLVTVHYRRSNGQSHLLTGPNDLRPANDDAARAHAGEHVADALVDFFSLDQVRLKRAMNFSFDRTNRQRDQVGIVLQTPLQTRVVTGIGQQMNAAGDLKRARDAAHDVAIALTVEFNLARFVLDELRLITSLDGAQFFGAAARQKHARQAERQQPDQQQHRQNDVKQANSTKAFEHQNSLERFGLAGQASKTVDREPRADRPSRPSGLDSE